MKKLIKKQKMLKEENEDLENTSNKEDADSSKDADDKIVDGNEDQGDDVEEPKQSNEYDITNAACFGFITGKMKNAWAYILNKNGKLPENKDELQRFIEAFNTDLSITPKRLCIAKVLNKSNHNSFTIFYDPSLKKWTSVGNVSNDQMESLLNSDVWKDEMVPAFKNRLNEAREMLEKYMKPFITDGKVSVDELKLEKVDKILNDQAILAGISEANYKKN